MTKFKNGPIEYYEFGLFIINGIKHSGSKNHIHGAGKDIRIIGNEVSAWEEREGHLLESSMITGVFHNDIDTLVIGAGAEEALKCPKEVIKYIKKQGIPHVIVRGTPKACQIYNRLFLQGEKVAMLAHGTC